MPTRPLRPCAAGQCAELVSTGYCTAHRRDQNQRRGTAHSRGYDSAHTKRRTLILHRDPVCRGCSVRVSTVDDHIVPISDGGSKSDDMNQQGLCADCHGFKTQVEQLDPTFGPRLRSAGAMLGMGVGPGEPAPHGWRKLAAFGGTA